jgi:sugar phosphate permease
MARQTEKLDAQHLEENGSDDWSREETEFTPKEQSKIIHRVDRRLVTTTGFMYCISLMDRTNLSNAAIAGMTKDLKLIDYRYSTITLVFFITYVLCQPPATVMCRNIGPQNFLASITVAWGVVMIGFGFVDNWTAMVGLRLTLGVFEAGFFPGCVYLLSTWYSRCQSPAPLFMLSPRS